MGEGQILDELVTLLEARSSTPILNPEAWRKATRARLEAQGIEAITEQHARLTGTRVATPSRGVDYHVRHLDHAITDAVNLLGRIDAQTGQRSLSDEDVWTILCQDYPQEIASRAANIAMEGTFQIQYGHSRRDKVDDPSWKRITLAEYLAANPNAAPPATEEAS
jgi:hypothetical protein